VGSCSGSEVTTERMLAWCAGWVTFTCRLAPLALDVFALVEAVNEGVNASAPQLLIWKGLDRPLSVAPNVDVRVDSVASAPQLVGL
jgi:hypothetical protein